VCRLSRDYLVTFAGWEQWDQPGRRDLGLAHMLLGSSIAYDWMFDRLSPDEQRIVRDSIGRWAHRMHQASSAGYQEGWTNWWAYSFIQFRFPTHRSALAMACLAVLLADPARSDTAATCKVSTASDVIQRWVPSS